MDIRSLASGQAITDTFAVLNVQERRTQQGKKYLVADLSHPSGTIIGKVWEDSLATAIIEQGKVYKIIGKADFYRDEAQLTISQAFELEDNVELYIKPKNTLLFDIETYGKPFDELSEWDQEYLLNTLQRQEPDKEKAKLSTALYPLYAEVISIGMFNPQTNKGMVFVVADKKIELENPLFTCKAFPTEKELLEEFWQTCKKYDRFVTFNGNRFDFPFLLFRSAVNKVKVLIDFNERNEQFVDLLQKFSCGNVFKLEALCRCLGITNPKEKGVSGLHVSRLYQDKQIKEIADYVSRDVVSTSELYHVWKSYMIGKIIL